MSDAQRHQPFRKGFPLRIPYAKTAHPLLRRLATAVFVLCIPAVIITTNVRIATNEAQLYEYGFDQYNVEARTGIERPELNRAARELIAYFNTDRPRADIMVEKDGEQVSLFNEREIGHLVDVKNLFRLVFRMQEIALALALAYIVTWFIATRHASLERLAREIIIGSGLTITLLIAVGGLALIGFDSFWTRFHLLAFSNDLWQLNPRRDRLIQMFPEDFWFDMTILVGLLSVLEALALALPAVLYLRLSGSESKEKAAAEETPLKAAQSRNALDAFKPIFQARRAEASISPKESDPGQAAGGGRAGRRPPDIP